MANITAAQVKELRERTGLPMMECKKALVSSEGDMEEAIKILREKGMLKGKGKESRVAADGLVDILKEGNVTVMVEVNSETDFVAKNDTFKKFVKGILNTIYTNRPASVEALFADKYDDTDLTVEEKQNEMRFTIGEKISIRRFAVIEGITSTYIHGNGGIGVVVLFDTDEATAAKPAFEEFAKNIALQVAAYNVSYVDRDAVPESVINEEKAILMAQIQGDPSNAKKPANIIEKMATGRLGKFYEANCLSDQEYVKDDSLKVSAYVAQTAKELGASIAIKAFYRFEKGEGIEKREDDLAAEVAKLTGQN